VTRVFDFYAQAREAVRALEAARIPSNNVSLGANKHVSAEHADVDDVSDAAKGPGLAPRSAAVPVCWRGLACWQSPAGRTRGAGTRA
jgi:hypothetical protein